MLTGRRLALAEMTAGPRSGHVGRGWEAVSVERELQVPDNDPFLHSSHYKK